MLSFLFHFITEDMLLLTYMVSSNHMMLGTAILYSENDENCDLFSLLNSFNGVVVFSNKINFRSVFSLGILVAKFFLESQVLSVGFQAWEMNNQSPHKSACKTKKTPKDKTQIKKTNKQKIPLQLAWRLQR